MRRFIGFIILIILWQVVSVQTSSILFPPASEVFPAFVRLFVTGEISDDIIMSMSSVIIGFVIAAVLGIGLAILIVSFKSIELILMPLVDAMRPVAAMTLFPLIMLALGLGIWSKVFMIVWTAWPAILLNTVYGLEKVDPDIREAAELDGADRPHLMYNILIPLAMPAIMTGLRIGLSGGYIAIISSEMLGSSAGLGYSILVYSQTFRFPEMYAIVLTIAMLGLGMNLILMYLQNLFDYSRDDGKKVKQWISPFIRFNDRAISYTVDMIKIGGTKNDEDR